MTALSPELATALEADAQVLTASPRAARALSLAYAEHARLLGRASWRAPRIDSWSSWTAQLYDGFAATMPLPLLLTPLQEEHVWLQVLAGDEAALAVVAPERLAQLAQSGYALLSAYEAHGLLQDSAHHDAEANQDAQHFVAWAAAFERRMQHLDALSATRVEELLARVMLHEAKRLPKELLAQQVWLVGFDRLTPAQVRLQSALRAVGVAVQTVDAAPVEAQRTVYRAVDPGRERAACALWIRGCLETDPSMRIGVLVPELASQRAAIERTFRRILIPTGAQIAAGGDVPYEFSLGDPLAKVPLIACALQLLGWVASAAATVSAAWLTTLLTSGLLATSAAEALALAEGDVALRRKGLLPPAIALGSLVKKLERRPNLLPAAFVQRLRMALAVAQPLLSGRVQRLPGEWAQQVLRLLEAFGWPGYRPVSSLTYQARQRWLVLLDQIALLDFTGERMGWAAFVELLTRATGQTLFTAETRGAPVQILGAAEAAGLSFDAVWFLHVQEETWPAPGRLHPLLIPTLQQQAGMPHARQELDLQLAQAQMRRIGASVVARPAGGLNRLVEAICSYSTQVDGAAARPSKLLPLFSAADAEDLPTALDGGAVPVAQYAVVRDAEPARGDAWPVARPAGGSEVLKRQAACGFQSFAVKRLKAERIEQETWGLDDRDRATLLHAALQHLWGPAPAGLLHTQDDLLVVRERDTLAEVVDEAIGRAIGALVVEAAGDAWLLAYLDSERGRLRTRLLAWLAVEAGRPEFAVEAVEEELRGVQVGPLTLNLRVDRVDLVEAENEESAGLLLLDYKTAAELLASAWDGERPDEPQLPIYALYGALRRVSAEAGRPVVGVAFAQVHAGKDQLIGRARNPGMQLSTRMSDKAQLKATLDDGMLAEWDAVLTRLAAEFASGLARVDPKRGVTTCRLCGLQGVCRVSAAELRAPEDGEETEGADA